MTRRVASLAAVAVIGGAALLYLPGLSHTPAYLMQDEVNFSLQAHAIATTGRDTNHRALPVYFSETGFEAGRDPLMIYWTAAFLVGLPLSESAVRLPTAVLGVVSVALMFVAARRLWRSNAPALVAALFLALTPGYFINSRLALSITYMVPIIALWLYCTMRIDDNDDGLWPLMSGALLGLGVYAYVACSITMPLLLAVTIAALLRENRRAAAIRMMAGFGLAMLPMGFWLVLHPDRVANLFAVYQLEGLSARSGVTGRLTTYWMFFSPEYLFLSGDGRLTNSTRAAGLFPLAFAVLIPFGLYEWKGVDSRRARWLVVAGLFIAPVATAVTAKLEINRVLAVIPFGVLVATIGFEALWRRGRGYAVLAVALLLSVPLQFAGFYADYFGRYRAVSGARFGGDNASAIGVVLDRLPSQSGAVYLPAATPIERYWLFYTISRHRTELAELPVYYNDSTDFDRAPTGALLVCEPLAQPCPVERRPSWTRIASIAMVDGVVSHTIYQLNR